MPLKEPFYFVDGDEKAKEFPATWHMPPMEARRGARVGDFVKAGVLAPLNTEDEYTSERFWVLVTEVTETGVKGTVNNHLVYVPMHGLDFGDEVEIEWKHILDVIDGSVVANDNIH